MPVAHFTHEMTLLPRVEDMQTMPPHASMRNRVFESLVSAAGARPHQPCLSRTSTVSARPGSWIHGSLALKQPSGPSLTSLNLSPSSSVVSMLFWRSVSTSSRSRNSHVDSYAAAFADR